MKRLIVNKWVLLALRLILGGIFIFAGAIKIAAPQSFADSIASFQILSHGLIPPMALGLPVFEVLVGSMLIIAWQKRAAAFSALFLTAIFGIALFSALARGLQVDCGCFGGGTASVWKTWVSLGRDSLLGVAAFIAYRGTISNENVALDIERAK